MADYLNGAETECLSSCLQLCARDQLDATLRALGDFEEEIGGGGGFLASQEGPDPTGQGQSEERPPAVLQQCSSPGAPQQLLPQLADKIVPKILHHYSTGSQERGSVRSAAILLLGNVVSSVKDPD
ncbi:maestro heat-like repeat-containing protein family member 2A [Mauremys mutica]|uniref:maestro heat-like repeat-containing protein family member 2A n=1 Tax=Mauremys mutica TaxID=74926 RepID=UPI001D161E7F|nr:maestro heat-like repeat-containing protein family member 2A [Mauremys mutica]